MLTAKEIMYQYNQGNIILEPFDETCLGPNSYDIHLGDTLLVYKNSLLDTHQENDTFELKIPEHGFILEPGILYLAKTVEYTETHKLIPMCEGRSSVGRLGIQIHATAGFGDIGFCGNWTLELSVVQPVRVYPGDTIGQLYWHAPTGEIEKTYNGKYQGSRDVVASRMYKDTH